MTDDPKRYRISLICHCNADLAYGYGPTEAAARAVARKHASNYEHKLADYAEEVVECVTPDGSHYETVTTTRIWRTAVTGEYTMCCERCGAVVPPSASHFCGPNADDPISTSERGRNVDSQDDRDEEERRR